MLTYTRPNAVELLFFLLTAGTVDRETSSARVEKTGVHYFRDACPVCVCLHGAEWAGPRILSPARTPPGANHAHRMGHRGVKVNTKPNSTPFLKQDHSRNTCFLYFFKRTHCCLDFMTWSGTMESMDINHRVILFLMVQEAQLVWIW